MLTLLPNPVLHSTRRRAVFVSPLVCVGAILISPNPSGAASLSAVLARMYGRSLRSMYASLVCPICADSNQFSPQFSPQPTKAESYTDSRDAAYAVSLRSAFNFSLV